MIKPCVVCWAEFDARGPAKACSPECRREYRRRYGREYLRATYHRRYKSKLAGQRRTCVGCGAEFTPRGWMQTTCGGAECKKANRRLYLSRPDQSRKRKERAAAYYARNKAKQVEYNRTSPKARANAARYEAEGRVKVYQRRSRCKRATEEAVADFARVSAELQRRAEE